MNHSLTRATVFCCFLLCIGFTSGSLAQSPAAPGKVRVLVITGGHAFENEPFFAMFKENPDITVETVSHPRSDECLKAGLSGKYDVYVLYDFNQTLTEASRADFVERLKEGKGLLVLHHGIAAYPSWPEYWKIIGARYYLSKTNVNGFEKARSAFTHGVDIDVHIADPGHPVTRGLKDFVIHDETYRLFDVEPGNHVLLTTGNTNSNKQIGWAGHYEASRVVYLELGHDHFAYENPNYRQLVRQAIAWVAPAPAAVPQRQSPAADVSVSAANYDEGKVAAYTLPDALTLANGKRVPDSRTWIKQRRPELLSLFETEMYGHGPEKTPRIKYEVTSRDNTAFGGKATRKEVRIWLTGRKDGPWMDLLLYLPNSTRKPVPVILGLNFAGNHTVCADPGIKLSENWRSTGKDQGAVGNRATEASRGRDAGSWQVDKILAQGYALATVFYGDIENDSPEGWKTGVRAALSKEGANTVWKPDEWGAISAWAWGLSRAMDYLVKDKQVDEKYVAVFGHSRLAKTALWAGARDERFAIVIANNSGEGGAALARRNFGETTANLNTRFPHWFCGNFKKYSGREASLPFDQHELLALIAPRPVYVASAVEDQWADPRGEFLAAREVDRVYRFLGSPGLGGVTDMPPLNKSVGYSIGYHIRSGKHDVTAFDWEQYLKFLDRFWF